MSIANQSGPAVFPALELQQVEARTDEKDYLMVRRRQMQWGDMLRGAVTFGPLQVTMTPQRPRFRRKFSGNYGSFGFSAEHD